METRQTRRELIKDALGVAGGGIAATATEAALGPQALAAPAPAQIEARALTRALQVEQLLVIAYRQVVASGILTPAVKGLLRTQLGHELEHVAVLQRALTARGEIVPAPPGLPAAQTALTRDQVHWSLHPRNQHGALKLLVNIESLAENAYFQVIEKAQDAGFARTCAQIMGCEAQHWTVLSGLLNHQDASKAAPYPFVQGTPTPTQA